MSKYEKKIDDEQYQALLNWAVDPTISTRPLSSDFSLSEIALVFENELKNYFSLAALSRSTNAPKDIVNSAYTQVFTLRVLIEQSVIESLASMVTEKSGQLNIIKKGSFFGCSKKQGISLRFPLSSCVPSKVCGAACYAHDVLDASSAAVIRGAVNGYIAGVFEKEISKKEEILFLLKPHVKKAVRLSLNEAKTQGRSREPRIRFSHVGEIAAYPNFANALAKEVANYSNNLVRSVIYTRHPNAHLLDPDLFVINFTLDKFSESRRNWATEKMRVVYSAFGGKITPDVSVNFLEHHRWTHADPSGTGPICPVTLPESKVRSCDGAKCDFCFRPVSELEDLQIQNSGIEPSPKLRLAD